MIPTRAWLYGLLAAAAGFACGAAGGIAEIAANRWLPLGFYRLAILGLRDSGNRGLVWGAAALVAGAAVWGLGRILGRPRGAAGAGLTAGILVLLLQISDFLLRRFSIYSLPLALDRVGKRIGELFSGRRGPAYLLELFPRHPELLVLALFLLAGMAALALAARKLSLREPPRAAAASAFILLAAAGILNLAPLALPRPASPHILLVVVDCLRYDALGDPERNPHLAGFAGESLAFPRAWASASWTKPAMATLLTGLSPARHGAVDPLSALPDGVATLAEFLRDRGYRTFFLNGGNPHLTAEFGFGQGFETVEITPRRHGADLLAALPGCLDSVGNSPFFGLLHFMDLHLPYNVNPHNPPHPPAVPAELAPGKLDFARAVAETGESPEARDYLRALYDGQVEFFDELFGRLEAILAERGLADSTIVVLTADHGEEFWEHAGYGHGHTLYNELLLVPLLIRVPGRRGEVGAVEPDQTEIFGLLLELAGLASPRFAPALDRRHPEKAEHFSGATSYGDEKFALAGGGWKLIHNTGRTRGKSPPFFPVREEDLELYDLRADPGETRDLFPEADAGILDPLRERLRELSGAEAVAGKAQYRPDRATLDQLKALGYLN